MRVRFSLRPPFFMELKNINSLVELFFRKSEKNIPKKFSMNESTFLTNLKPKKHELPELRQPNNYSWRVVDGQIRILSTYLKKIISRGDRCLLLSENRPEWLISDLSIMNAGGVTVPLFTTYSCLLYTSPSPRDMSASRMPSSA